MANLIIEVNKEEQQHFHCLLSSKSLPDSTTILAGTEDESIPLVEGIEYTLVINRFKLGFDRKNHTITFTGDEDINITEQLEYDYEP